MAKRKQHKLVLQEGEISLIRGLVIHTDLNDQMIVAIFSHLSRTINHREIGYFRDPENQKYQKYPIASKTEIQKFLSKYERFERLAKIYGIVPQEAYFQLVQKASEAMKTAVGIYNNPAISWKSEIFIVNAVIAWTYLMHSHYLKSGIDYQYKRGGKPVLTDDGQPKLWELSQCITVGACPLPAPVKLNLKYLIAIRNEIEHRISDNIDASVAPKLQACALNFNEWMCKWFGDEHSVAHDLSFAIQFSQLSLEANKAIVGEKGLPKVIQVVNAIIEDSMSIEEYNDPRYSFRVHVVPRTVNNKGKADQAVVFSAPGSDVELAVREVERPKYRAKEIIAIMNSEGFTDFNMFGKQGFVPLWKELDAKNPGKGLGVEIAGQWLWYYRMIDVVREILRKRAGGSSE